MNRADAIKKIVHLLDTKCGPCEVKKDRGRGTGKAMNAAQFQQHCIKECPVSLEMQKLSRHLGGTYRRKRKDKGRKQALTDRSKPCSDHILKSQKMITKINNIALLILVLRR